MKDLKKFIATAIREYLIENVVNTIKLIHITTPV